MAKTLTPVEAKRLMDSNNNIVVLDIREEEELIEGYIENSILLPVNEVEARIKDILPTKNTKILTYCRSGKRSIIANEILSKLGYTDVNTFGGIIDWPFDKIL